MVLNPNNARGPYRKKPIANRLAAWSIPVPFTGCLLWLGTIGPDGYGRLSAPRDEGYSTTRLAHVIAYEDTHGRVPDGLVLDHRCRVRCCVNPAHLEPVTQGVNVRRGFAGGRPDRGRIQWR